MGKYKVILNQVGFLTFLNNAQMNSLQPGHIFLGIFLPNLCVSWTVGVYADILLCKWVGMEDDK